MIPKEIIEKLLKELEKSGNIGASCHRAGVSRSQFYRWMKSSKTFRKEAKRMSMMGRGTMYDAYKQALDSKALKGDTKAIIYGLEMYEPHKNRTGCRFPEDISEYPERIIKKIMASRALPPIQVKIVKSKHEIVEDQSSDLLEES